MNLKLIPVALLLAVTASAQAAVIIDFSSWGGGNTPINDDPLGFIFTVTMNGDGTVSVTENAAAVGIDSTGGASSIAVTGTTTSMATGSFTITFDGTESDGITDTAVQLRTTGLGVVGRNAGRIDYNAVNGDPTSEVLDVILDASSLSGVSVLVTEAGFENWQNSAEAVLTDFDDVSATVATATVTEALGGAGYTLSGGSSDTMLFSVVYDSNNGARGYSVSSFSFDVVDSDVIPEPSTILLLSLGLVGFAQRR